MAARPRSVLIVESRAHERNGHFPVRCAQLAAAYAELGFRVELLTSIGWARADEHPAPPFAVREWRPWLRWARRTERPWAVTLLNVVESRARARRMSPAPDLVVVLAWSELPELLATFAPLRARWLVHHWGYAHDLPRVRRFDALAARRERQRRARGGKVRLVVAHEYLRRDWAVRAPYLDPVIAPIVGVRDDVDPLPDARERLGLPRAGKLALLFGDARLKRLQVVLDAFRALEGWTLVVGGPIAEEVASGPGVIRFPGVVDDSVRDLLFAAVDVVVLSFSPHYPNESGTLMDALTAATPVVCSDDATVADAIVKPHRLGVTFAADDPAALAAAVRAAPATLDPDDLARARLELSNRAVATRQLALLDVDVVGT